MITFVDYLRTLKVHDSVRGDFIKDALEDKCLEYISDKDTLVDYLMRWNACENAVKQAKYLWGQFEKVRMQ